MQFTPPDQRERERAIGPLDQLPQAIRPLFDPSHFYPINAPGAQDWLANHSEPGQSYPDFIRSHPNFPDQTRRAIFLHILFHAGECAPGAPSGISAHDQPHQP